MQANRFQRRRTRGITFLEGGVVLALVTVITGVFFFWSSHERSAQESADAQHVADRIFRAARAWQEERNSGCPTISQLKHDHLLDAESRVDDPWGDRFRVVCADDAISVRSAGRDGQVGTKDDIRVPRSTS